MLQPYMFNNPDDACNFVLAWDGKSTNELLKAINHTRQEGDRFQQEKILRRIARLPFDFPRPTDIPIFMGAPVWAVDSEGQALIGMPGSEYIEHVDELRKKLERGESFTGLFRTGSDLL
jgi:hypothetical protein